jgi:hypothetical protein
LRHQRALLAVGDSAVGGAVGVPSCLVAGVKTILLALAGTAAFVALAFACVLGLLAWIDWSLRFSQWWGVLLSPLGPLCFGMVAIVFAMVLYYIRSAEREP